MKLLVIVLLVMIPTIVLATTSEVFSKKETLKEKTERLDEVCEQLLEEGPPETVAVGPHVKMGKALEWFINNTNKPDGWSLTGYSSLKVDERGNMSRWKVGIINGELDWSTYQDIEGRNEPSYRLLEEWNQRMSSEMVFGISFSREF